MFACLTLPLLRAAVCSVLRHPRGNSDEFRREAQVLPADTPFRVRGDRVWVRDRVREAQVLPADNVTVTITISL